MNVDILVTGHTHKCVIEKVQGRWIVNPGSITGAYSCTNKEPVIPSFVLMAIQGSKAVAYVYKLIDDVVSVSKTELTKEE